MNWCGPSSSSRHRLLFAVCEEARVRGFASPTPGGVGRRPEVGAVALGQLQRLIHRHQAEPAVPQAVVLGVLHSPQRIDRLHDAFLFCQSLSFSDFSGNFTSTVRDGELTSGSVPGAGGARMYGELRTCKQTQRRIHALQSTEQRSGTTIHLMRW